MSSYDFIDDFIDTYKSYAEDYRKETYDMSYSTQQRDYARDKSREYEQLADWLVELKEIRKWKSEIISEFAKYDATCADEIYQKGRADYAKEIAVDFDEMDKTAYRMGRADGIAQGRVDAIDEAVNYFSDHANEIYSHVSARDFICDRLEQLKEGTND